jgi:hypothetical protein
VERVRLLLFYWLPPIALMSLIFYLSSLSGLPDFHAFDMAVKKAAHVGVYGLLYFLLFRSFHSIHGARVAPSSGKAAGASPSISLRSRLSSARVAPSSGKAAGASPSISLRSRLSSARVALARTHLFAGLIGLLYAISDEIYQYFVPLRNAAVRDVAIDSMGMLLVCILLKSKPALFSWLLRKG